MGEFWRAFHVQLLHLGGQISVGPNLAALTVGGNVLIGPGASGIVVGGDLDAMTVAAIFAARALLPRSTWAWG